MLEFGNSAYPKARKVYECDLCGQKILKGEIYYRWSGKYDGEMFDLKYHPVCQNIITTYCHAMNEQEYSYDEIYDWLHDNYCLDCKKHEEDDCEVHPVNCPLIRKKFEQEDNLTN